MSPGKSNGILCVLAHQDDEVAMASSIAREAQGGRSIYCAFLTDGSGKGDDPATRNAESRKVLVRLGVPAANLLFIGTELRLPDLGLIRNLDLALAELELRTSLLDLDEILCMAWEGGHPDHDASHLISLGLARRRSLLENTWQFSIYNANRRRRFVRVMSQIEHSETRTRRLSLREGLRFGMLGFGYASQWVSWLGLTPGILWQMALRRREVARRASLEAVRRKPHEGQLLYERRYGVSYTEFRRFSDEFIQKNL